MMALPLIAGLTLLCGAPLMFLFLPPKMAVLTLVLCALAVSVVMILTDEPFA